MTSQKGAVSALDVRTWLRRQSGTEYAGWWTDPPYPSTVGHGLGGHAKVSMEETYDLLSMPELEQVATTMLDLTVDGGFLFWMTNRGLLRETDEMLERAGWTVRNAVAWVKYPAIGPSQFALGHHFQNGVEFVMYGTKGEPRRLVNDRMNVHIELPPPGRGRNAKPERLVAHCIDGLVDEHELVGDPFAGSNPLRRAVNQRLVACVPMTNALVTGGPTDPAWHQPGPPQPRLTDFLGAEA